MWDTENRKYLDFSAGIAVNALGHADEDVTKVSYASILCCYFYSRSCGFSGVACQCSHSESTSEMHCISVGARTPPDRPLTLSGTNVLKLAAWTDVEVTT